VWYTALSPCTSSTESPRLHGVHGDPLLPLGRGRYNSPQRVDRAPLGPKAAGPREDRRRGPLWEGETKAKTHWTLVPKRTPSQQERQEAPVRCAGK